MVFIWIKWYWLGIKLTAPSSYGICLTSETGNYLSCSVGSPLMLVFLSSKLSYKLKTWLHQGWFVGLAHSEICWSIPSSSGTHSCIFVVYSDGAESGRKTRSNRNVHESWSYLKLHVDPTRACEQSYTWFWIENGSEGCVVERSGELVLAQSCKFF